MSIVLLAQVAWSAWQWITAAWSSGSTSWSTSWTAQSDPDVVWTCITNWTCTFNTYNTLWIRQETQENNSAELFVQDIFLASTLFVGTIVTLWLLVSGLMMIFSWADEWKFEKGKTWLKYSFIALLLVIFSYTIIRAVQFIAQWNR